MPEEIFNPAAEAKRRWPGLAQMTDDQVFERLSDPVKFRSAFPELERLPDETIIKNVTRFRRLHTGAVGPSATGQTLSPTGALAVRQNPKEAVAKLAPAVGEFIGSTAGGLAGAGSVIPGGAALGAGAGGVLGRKVGKTVQEMMLPEVPRPTSLEEVAETGLTFGLNALGEGLGGAAMGRVLKPTEKATLAAAEAAGMPLSAAQRSGSPTQAMGENFLKRTLTGREPFVRLGGKQIAKGEELYSKIADSIADKVGHQEMGVLAEQSYNNRYALHKAAVDQAFDDLDFIAGTNTASPVQVNMMPVTIQAQHMMEPINRVVAASPSLASQDSAAYKMLEDAATKYPQSIPFRVAHDLKSRLLASLDYDQTPLAGQAKGAIKQVVKAIDQAMEDAATAGHFVPEWRNADALFKRGAQNFGDDVIKSIVRKDPEKIVTLIRPRDQSLSTIDRLQTVLDPYTFRKLGRRWLEDIYETSAIKTEAGIPVVDPEAFAKKLRAYGDETTKKMLGPDGAAAVEQFAKVLERGRGTQQMAAHPPGAASSIVSWTQSGAVLTFGTMGMTAPEGQGAAQFLGAGGVLIAPNILARMMTNQATARLLARAATTSPTGKAAGGIASRLAIETARLYAEDSRENKMPTAARIAPSQHNVPQMIERAATEYGIDPKLALALAETESGFNPMAKSAKGAIGVMQLMPDTAASLKVNPYDLKSNVYGGVRYLRFLLEKYEGDAQKALAAYNAGPTRADAERGLPLETKRHIARIMARYGKALPTAPVVTGLERPATLQSPIEEGRP